MCLRSRSRFHGFYGASRVGNMFHGNVASDEDYEIYSQSAVCRRRRRCLRYRLIELGAEYRSGMWTDRLGSRQCSAEVPMPPENQIDAK